MTTPLTTAAKLDAIRKKCVEVNPSITDLMIGCRFKRDSDDAVCIVTMDHDFGSAIVSYWHPTVAKPAPLLESEFEIIGRPISLADVLLAIGFTEKQSRFYVEVGTGRFIEAHYIDIDTSKDTDTGIYWNLRQDDLDQQSPETIDFLYSLLCA